MASIQHTPQERARFLRLAMLGNAAFSGLSGLVLLIGSRPLSTWLGIPWPGGLAGTGAALIGYGLMLLWVATREALSHRVARLAIVLDLGWVIGSFLLLLFGWLPLTPAGRWTVLILAEIVAAFAVLQAYGLRRMN